MAKIRVLVIMWVLFGLISAGINDAEVAEAAASPAFLTLPVSAVSPASGQVVPPSHVLQVKIDIGSAVWTPALAAEFKANKFGLRLLNTSSGKKYYFLPKHHDSKEDKIIFSDAIKFDPGSGLLTVAPESLALDSSFQAILASGKALKALLDQDEGENFKATGPLCCTYPASNAASWSFRTTKVAANTTVTVTANGGTASTPPTTVPGGGIVTASITGTGSLNLAPFGTSNPAPNPPSVFTPYGGYFDLSLNLGNTPTQLVLKECGANGINFYYYSGTGYLPVSPVPQLAGGCLSVTLDGGTTPNLSQLSGTIFTTGIPVPTVTGLSSNKGAATGGETLKISGTNFTDQNGVSLLQGINFGTAPVAPGNFSVLSSTLVEVWVTPSGVGSEHVQVTTGGGQSQLTSSDLYTFSTLPPSQKIAVPAYFFPGPGTDWDRIAGAAPVAGLAVINPSNGPGTGCNPTYASQVTASQQAGVKVLGYVYTRYANTQADLNGTTDRTVAAVKSDVDTYYSCYPTLDGIFFDEASQDCSFVSSYYGPLGGYLKTKPGLGLVALNPGAAGNECYLTAADILVTFEGEVGNYLTPAYSQPAWTAKYPSNRFWHLVYNVLDSSALQATINASQQHGAGWVYATPLDCANNAAPPCTSANPLNPWYALPPAGYWSDEQQLVQPALPVITALSRTSSPANGGASLVVTGQNFGEASRVCFGSYCLFPSTSAHPSGFSINPARTQITLTTPPGTAGTTVDVAVTTPVGSSQAASAAKFSYSAAIAGPTPVPGSVTPAPAPNLFTNANFGNGLAGWTLNCKGFSGLGYAEGSGCSFTTSTGTGNYAGGLTLASTGNPPYEGVYQIVPATANSVLSGSVLVNRMYECGDGSVSVSVTLLDANQKQLGNTLNQDPMFGNIVFSHHPYLNCSAYIYPNTSTSFFQDMPGWQAGNGPQTFSMNISSIISQYLPGITASQVAYVKVQLTNYADNYPTQPSVTFSSLSLAATAVTSGFPTLNVRDFGAAGDGITDDTVAFTSALGQLNNPNGGLLIVPAGTYSVQPNQLVVKSNTTIFGSGAILKARSSGYVLLDITGSNIYLSGLTLDANNLVPGIANIDPNSSQVVLTGISFQNARQPIDSANPYYLNDVIGLQVYGNSNDILLDSLTVKNIVSDHASCDPNGCTRKARGIRFSLGSAATTTAKNLTVQNSNFLEIGPKDDGDCLVIQDSIDSANLQIINNTFDRCHKRAIKIQVPGVIIGYNTIKNSFQPGENFTTPADYPPYTRSNFQWDMYSAISVYQNNVNLTGNTLTGIGSYYNAVEVGASCNLSNISLQNNLIQMGTNAAAVLGASLVRMITGVTNLYIYGNTLSYTSLDTANYKFGIVQPVGVTVDPKTYTLNNNFINVLSYDLVSNYGALPSC